jgi:PAS domain S-box-containing protein
LFCALPDERILTVAGNTESRINNHQSLRVLIVEDSEDDVLLIIRELKKGGFNPIYERVETAAAMRKALKEKQWDIILCDYKLPQFSAPSAIALLKETNIDIPILIISGKIGEDTAAECMLVGAQDYIMKNNMSRLCPAIARELDEADSRNKRKQMEQALSQSEEKYRNILENIEDGYYEVDLAGNFTFFNGSLCRILGFSHKEMISMNNRQYTEEEGSKKLFHVLNQVYKTGEPAKEFDWQIIRKDGTKRHIEASVSLLKDLSGKPTGFRGIVRDITERKLADQSLRESEKYFKEITENSSDIIVITDKNGDIKYCSRSIERFSGYKPEELIGKSVFIFIHPDEVERAAHDFGEAIAIKDSPIPPNAFRVVHKDASERYFEGMGKNLLDNPSVAGIVMNIHDVTERRLAEEALRKNEAKYRQLAEDAHEGIFQSTAEGRYITVNQAFANILGYESPEEVVKNITDIAHQVYVHPEDRANIVQIIEKEGSVKGYEAQFYRKDGSKTWVSINMHAIRDDQGNLLYYQGIDQDITDRKKMEKERQENIERLRRSLGATINAMAVTVETRDPYTAGHQRRVADLARTIASEMRLTNEQIDGIRMASMIHDIGKISIPSEILAKPTKLTELEFSLIKTHSQSGYNILKDIDFLWPVAQIILQHHERINGSGYPNGLTGEQILLESQILAVADVVEAISSHRPYRPAFGINIALNEITKNRGILYNPDIVDACLRLFGEKNYKFSV